MPRGRHRHSPPLHKLLPPSAVAGAAVVCAAAAWLPGDLVVVRLLAAAAAGAAVTGAVLMRSWDRSAGRQVAELNRARTADQWKADERTAELEADLEESRALRARLDAKLRAKRVELAALRGEHADLLRRYATAETERASALEGRRVLALEATAATAGDARALPAAGSTPTPEAYRRAAVALRDLPRNAAAQRARRTAGRTADAAEEDAEGKHPAAGGTEQHTRSEAPALTAAPAAGITGTAGPAGSGTAPTAPPVPVAAAVVPYTARRPAPRPEGGFDFFGTQKAAAAIEAVQNTDLADVVGDEVLQAARVTPLTPAPPRTAGQVIDLTAHDETEQLDVVELRGAVNS
ncbi:hypothetical protein [Streptomyces sp.]|uniref:hypothetical protein n=1 Tax=Streptomyces sp. TaxID=1931 RepID=UPI0028125079|nr:hypothetical protein [Streptomyces sp.]